MCKLDENPSKSLNGKELSYAELLNQPEWKQKHLEILERDNFKCRKCDDGEISLKVHRRFYTYRLNPWDYPNDSLETLCNHCHKKIHKAMRDCKIKLGKVLAQVPMGRFTMTTIESTLLDEEGNEIASAPLLTSLPLDEIEVDENFVVTNAVLSAPDKNGKRCWLVKLGENSGDSESSDYRDDPDYSDDLDLDEDDEDFDDGTFGTGTT